LIVVDASALAAALADDDTDGDVARKRLEGEQLAAPEVIDLEIASMLRRQCRVGAISLQRALTVLADLQTMRLSRRSHVPLLDRIWELRENVTPYDAAYVALAEDLGATLVTADARLDRAPGPRCAIEVLV
jgi:predicted nucleic acid-binding protein